MEESIWTNSSANSPFGQCPLRMALEKETDQNSLREGNRLEQEAERLKSHHDEKSGKDITFVCLPTQVDGKVKFCWSQTTTSMCNCYICGAKPSEMAHRIDPRNGNNFTPDRKALSFGFSPLHVKMRCFDWVCKTGIYRDFKKWKCVGDDLEHKTRRKDQLKLDFFTLFGFRVYESKGQFQSVINGNLASAAFANPALFSQITDVPVSLIKGIAIALEGPSMSLPNKFNPNFLPLKSR